MDHSYGSVQWIHFRVMKRTHGTFTRNVNNPNLEIKSHYNLLGFCAVGRTKRAQRNLTNSSSTQICDTTVGVLTTEILISYIRINSQSNLSS